MGQLGLEDSFIDIYSMEDVPRQIPSKSFSSDPNNVDSVIGEGKIVKIAAGRGRSAAVTSDGRVYLWGHRVSHMPKLVPLPPSVTAVDVACGGNEIKNSGILILTDTGNIWTMGFKGCQALGIDSDENSPEINAARTSLGESVGAVDHAILPRVVVTPFHPQFKVNKVSFGLGGHAAALAVGRG